MALLIIDLLANLSARQFAVAVPWRIPGHTHFARTGSRNVLE
jgi:hypothetical protein